MIERSFKTAATHQGYIEPHACVASMGPDGQADLWVCTQGHYMVRNVWHQDLGLIDAYGRAYRYVPHSSDPAWVGSGSVRQGVERILGLAGCELSEFPLAAEARPASPGELEQRRMNPPNPLEQGS